MRGELKNVIKVACIYAMSVIGAGFASGQEIMQFFSIYKTGGFYGVLLAGALFAAVGGIVLVRVFNERIRNYEEFIFPVYGWHVGWVIEILVTVFMLFLFCIMVAGSASVLSDRLSIMPGLSVAIMDIICLALILTDIKGIAVISTVVTPALLAGVVLAALYIICVSDVEASGIIGYLTYITGNWFFSTLLYVSYNSIAAIVIMCSLLPYLKTRRTAAAGGIAGGLMLGVAAFVINGVIYMSFPLAFEKELPILSILKNFSAAAGDIYAAVLWLAMLVSAVTSGFCFAGRLGSALKIDSRIAALLLSIFAMPLAAIGFSRLISAIYPVFGYLGLFIIIVILLQEAARLFALRRDRYGRK